MNAPDEAQWDGAVEVGGPAEDAFTNLKRQFESHGLAGRVGFGDRPALLIVDMQLGFTDPTSPLGAEADGTVAAVKHLASHAREADVPIVYTTCVRSTTPDAEAWASKLPAQRDLVPGSEWTQIDPRLARLTDELLIEKHFASAFFGTDLSAHFKALGIDTIIIAGMTTSGCVRASVVDGCSYGFKIAVAKEAVADRADEPHLMSLFDMDAKYADVVTCVELFAYFATLKPRSGETPENKVDFAADYAQHASNAHGAQARPTFTPT